MNIDEIRKNRPEGATHYSIESDGVYYYQFQNMELYYWDVFEKYYSRVKWDVKLKPL